VVSCCTGYSVTNPLALGLWERDKKVTERGEFDRSSFYMCVWRYHNEIQLIYCNKKGIKSGFCFWGLPIYYVLDFPLIMLPFIAGSYSWKSSWVPLSPLPSYWGKEKWRAKRPSDSQRVAQQVNGRSGLWLQIWLSFGFWGCLSPPPQRPSSSH
jgi:hypothetical protein